MANLRCEDVMTRNPRCCEPKDTVLDAIRLMKENNVGSVPVCEQDNRLVGVLTDRDVAMGLSADKKPSECRVSDFMSEEPITCRPEDDAFDAAQLMEDRQIRRIPVVDNDNVLQGIISTADIARQSGTHDRLFAQLPDIMESVSAPS